MLSAKSRSGRGATPYLRNINVRWGHIDTSDLLVMDFDTREREKYALREGDVLVCEGGEPGRAAVWHDQVPGTLYQKALHRVRFRGNVLDPQLFVLELELAAKTWRLADYFTGTTIKHLPRESFLEFQVVVPPAEEQRRLRSVLEENLSELEAAVAGLRRMLARADSLRQAILKRAFRGELVAQNLNDEPAQNLLKLARLELTQVAPSPGPRRTAPFR